MLLGAKFHALVMVTKINSFHYIIFPKFLLTCGSSQTIFSGVLVLDTVKLSTLQTLVNCLYPAFPYLIILLAMAAA